MVPVPAGASQPDQGEDWHGRNVGNVETGENRKTGRSGGNDRNGGLGKHAASTDSVADSPNMWNRILQWHCGLPVLEAELARIAWDDEPVGIQGEDFIREATLTPQAPLAREHQFENDRAANWLHQRLCSGKTPAVEVQAAAAEHEIGEALLRRAFRNLGCKTQKEKEPGGKARWYWRLPGEGFLTRRAGPRFIAQSCS